ncbi:hypothetical protein AXK60_02025 [Tsukamurella pseudospumae]|uniref:Uncharacterized protein n=1 Tax=Tsukamurella pseudospumae TaxID=239498 RepID=A0A138AWA5_9ACTN|nr:hypothetical protein AXK60_02025 [Tsukamurella pseudospumae]
MRLPDWTELAAAGLAQPRARSLAAGAHHAVYPQPGTENRCRSWCSAAGTVLPLITLTTALGLLLGLGLLLALTTALRAASGLGLAQEVGADGLVRHDGVLARTPRVQARLVARALPS